MRRRSPSPVRGVCGCVDQSCSRGRIRGRDAGPRLGFQIRCVVRPKSSEGARRGQREGDSSPLRAAPRMGPDRFWTYPMSAA